MSYIRKDIVKVAIKESKKDLREMRKAVIKNKRYQAKKIFHKPFSFDTDEYIEKWNKKPLVAPIFEER